MLKKLSKNIITFITLVSLLISNTANAQVLAKLLGSTAPTSGAPVTGFVTVGSGLQLTGNTLSTTGGGGGGCTVFTCLTDTPMNYTSAGLKLLRVNTGATAIEYVTPGALYLLNAVGSSEITDGSVALSDLANISTATILGRNTAGSGVIEQLSASTTKTLLSLNNVENTALSTWAGTTNITTLGTISTGSWNATNIGIGKGGTGATLADPNADRLMFWDDSSGSVDWLSLGTNLSITGTTINASASVADGDKGDITVSGSGATWMIDAKVTSFSVDTSATTSDHLGGFVFTGNNKTLTLPDASALPGETMFIAHQGSGVLTISATGGDTVDGSSLYLTQSQGVIVTADGANNWFVSGAFKYPGTTFAYSSDMWTGTNAYIFVPPSAASAFFSKGADIASASTLTIGDDDSFFHVTGTTTVNALSVSTSYMTGREVVLVFDGALQLTNSSNLILPTGANITTAAGDTAHFRLETATPTNIWRCVSYDRASGAALVSGGGGVSDGDKGDISVASSGTVWTIDNDVVTFAKAQNIATDRLVGRDSASSGDMEELTLDSTLEFTGSGGIRRAALTGDVTATAGSNSTTIANDAVTYAKIQNVSATDKLLGRSTAGAGDIEEIACTSAGRALLDDADAAAQRATLSAGYTVSATSLNAATLTDAQTIYIGSKAVAPTTTAAITRIYIPRAGTIKGAYVHGNFGTAGTAESWTMYIRLNNTTDTTIQAQAVSATSRVWSNSGLSITVAAGDYIEIKSINPTWATNPANMTLSAVIYIE